METLSNADVADTDSGIGFTPFVLPEAKSSQTGVSVEYAPMPDKHWYVIRASYGHDNLAADSLIEAGYYAYVPRRYNWTKVHRRPKRVLENLMPNIVFAYLHPHEADIIVKDNDVKIPSPCPQLTKYLSYYYDHFTEVERGKNPPLTIPPMQMYNFIRITATNDEHILLVQDEENVHLKSNDVVEVIDGMFKGVQGKVVRVAGQQRVGIRLANFGWVTTAYVPRAFLRVLPISG